MASHGKKYLDARAKVDVGRRYGLNEAIDVVLNTHYVKFDETVDLAIVLGVDPRKADQNVRSSVILPHGTGRTQKVLAIAKGEKAKEAEDAGADYVGAEDVLEKIKGGWLDFDKVVATPDMMSMVGRIGKILGPRGMMPNAKTGTVTFDVARAVNEIKAGKVDFRVDKGGVVHVPLGKVSFGSNKIKENFASLAETLLRIKPSTSKGTYVRSVALSTTMGPGVRVDPSEVKTVTS
ncbi:MAG: 50S ribosomal protein L1 [Thermodesulfobacteriota bacterium]|nr:50S ribosomal protein L1 [Thermodesulfobacteriota bacterium]